MGLGEVGEQSAQGVFERAGDAFDRMEFAAAGTGIPLIEKRATLVAILLLPKAGEVFLAQPSSGWPDPRKWHRSDLKFCWLLVVVGFGVDSNSGRREPGGRPESRVAAPNELPWRQIAQGAVRT